jgi:hypothetical protein
MDTKSQTGLASELFVAAELAKQGHIVTITFGNEKAIDLMVAHRDDPKKTVSIDVKGLKKPAPWALGNFGNKTRHPEVYIFCHLNKAERHPEYFIIPTNQVKKLVGYSKDHKSGWIPFKEVKTYQGKWELLWEEG